MHCAALPYCAQDDRLEPILQFSKHKYIAVIDGIGPTNRYLEILGLGSLLFKMRSRFRLHFEGGLQPYVHYVPFW